jgi:hypothetical protein
MTTQLSLPGIRFPTRAERLDSEMFEDYKVFVDFWNPLTEALTESFRALQIRDEAAGLGTSQEALELGGAVVVEDARLKRRGAVAGLHAKPARVQTVAVPVDARVRER